MRVKTLQLVGELAKPFLQNAVKNSPSLTSYKNVSIDFRVLAFKQICGIIPANYACFCKDLFLGLGNKAQIDIVKNANLTDNQKVSALASLPVQQDRVADIFTQNLPSNPAHQLYLIVYRPHYTVGCTVLVDVLETQTSENIKILKFLAVPKDDTLWIKFYCSAYFFPTIRDWLLVQEKLRLKEKGHRSTLKYMKIR